jgi:nucleoside-diphosphate-sugar epimerase
MKVAVIGANGFIGSRVTEMFHLGARHEVVPVVRRASGLARPARFAVDWRIGDALDVTALAAALAGCEAVVHAALGDPRQIEAMPAVLCAAAAAARVPRVVYLSSATVHGQAPATGTTEATPLHCHHALLYNNAKVRAERAFFRACARHRLTGFALRPGVVFGPRSRWVADASSAIRAGRGAWINGGHGICNSVYVDNLVEAVHLALVAPGGGEAFLIGDEETVTWRDFLGPIARHAGLDDSAFRDLPVPRFRPERESRLTALTLSPAYGRLGPLVPARAKRLVKAWLRAWPTPPPAPDPWTLHPVPPRPALTHELALLQQCTWKFPHDRAAARLGYRPTVTFAEGLRRSLAWLDFAEGRG